MPKDEDNSEDQYDLNAQLYAAARTNELLTSLRLLAQGFIFCLIKIKNKNRCWNQYLGARPDWTNSEKSNNSALHVACQNNQPFQVFITINTHKIIVWRFNLRILKPIFEFFKNVLKISNCRKTCQWSNFINFFCIL